MAVPRVSQEASNVESEGIDGSMLASMGGFRRARKVPAWRKLALGTWSMPSSPAAYGMLDLDCEAALAWCVRAREASGEKVTLTHLVGKAVAVAIASAPETNGFASFGRLMLRDTVDVFFQVAFFDRDAARRPRRARGRRGRTRTWPARRWRGWTRRASSTWRAS